MNKKRKLLETMLNLPLRGEITSMFGTGSHVKVDRLDYIRSKKTHMVHIKLFLTDVESGVDFYPSGLELIVKKAWKALSNTNEVIIVSSIDVK
jgi:hypothetical protein